MNLLVELHYKTIDAHNIAPLSPALWHYRRPILDTTDTRFSIKQIISFTAEMRAASTMTPRTSTSRTMMVSTARAAMPRDGAGRVVVVHGSVARALSIVRYRCSARTLALVIYGHGANALVVVVHGRGIRAPVIVAYDRGTRAVVLVLHERAPAPWSSRYIASKLKPWLSSYMRRLRPGHHHRWPETNLVLAMHGHGARVVVVVVYGHGAHAPVIIVYGLGAHAERT